MNENIKLNAAKFAEVKWESDTLPHNEKKLDLLYSVDDAVNNAGYGRFQIRLLILAGLGWFADAAEIFILSLLGDFMACEWELHRWQIALLTSAVFGSVVIGSPVFGIIADIYGRKRALSISMVMLFIFGAVSAAAPSFTWMVILRVCVGIALGGIGQGLTLCSEYCPADMRGKTGFYLCYFWSLGSVGVILLSWGIMSNLQNWRILLAVVSIPVLVVVLSLKFYPESARYYLVSNQRDNAKRILKTMTNMNGKHLLKGELVEVADNCKRGRITDLLGKEYRLTTLLLWYIWFASAIAYYGIVLISPLIISKGNLVAKNSNETDVYFEDMNSLVPCGKYSQQFYIDMLWTSAAEFPGLIIFTMLVEHLSRKLLLAGACIISSGLIFLQLLNIKKMATLLFLFGARGILCAIFQLDYIMTAEAFPTTFRALAVGTGTAFCRLGGIVVPFVAQVLIIENPVLAICLMAGVIFVGGIAAIFLPVETRGVQMKDVH